MIFPFAFWQDYNASNLQKGLIAYYSFNSNTPDDSTTGHYNLNPLCETLYYPGVIVARFPPTYLVEILPGFQCTGNNSLFSTNPIFNVSSDRTFAFWLNIQMPVWSEGSISAIYLFTGGYDSTSTPPTGAYQFVWSSPQPGFSGPNSFSFQFVTTGNSSINSISLNATVSSGVWHYIVGWIDYNNQTAFLQIDNNLTGIKSAAWPSNYNPRYLQGGHFSIGNPAQSPGVFRWFGNSMSGVIDEVGIWNRQLSQEERTYLYNYGRGRTWPFIPN